MKRFSFLILTNLLLLPLYASADASKVITLSPGWNVVSTPALLSSIDFSNEGEGISFSKLSNGKWISAPANTTNIKPLEGFMVYNSNSDNVTMTLRYKTDVSPMQSIFQRNLNYGWDFVGITTTNSPFNNIGSAAVMSVDFTNNGSTNYLNKVVVGGNYTINTTSSSINEPQLGEAYGIFVNQQNAIYGGVNNLVDDEGSNLENGGSDSGGEGGNNGNEGGNSGESGGGENVGGGEGGNSGDEGNSSGNNSKPIFMNRLGDLIVYSGNNGNGGRMIRYDEDDKNIFYTNGYACSFGLGDCESTMIASGKINVEDEKTISFTINGDGINQIQYMYLLIDGNLYRAEDSENDFYKDSWTFENVDIYPNAPFVIFFGSFGSINDNYSFTVEDDEIILKLRNITIQDYNLYDVTGEKIDDFKLYKGEKTSHVIYSGLFNTAVDLTINKLEGKSKFIGKYGNFNPEDMVHNEQFFHIYLDDQEIWNSNNYMGDSYIYYNSYEEIPIGKDMEPFRLNSGEHSIKIIEDFLIVDAETNQNAGITSLSLIGDTDNSNNYTLQIINSSNFSGPRIEIKNPRNSNIITVTESNSYGSCIIDNYKYETCDSDSEGNNKIIVFNGTYATNESQITLKSFKINHLTGNNFNHIFLNFELYINDILVKEFGMDDINEQLDLDDILITTEPSTIKLLAIPLAPSSKFRGSITFNWEDNEGTSWRDSIGTRDDVYSSVKLKQSYYPIYHPEVRDQYFN